MSADPTVPPIGERVAALEAEAKVRTQYSDDRFERLEQKLDEHMTASSKRDERVGRVETKVDLVLEELRRPGPLERMGVAALGIAGKGAAAGLANPTGTAFAIVSIGAALGIGSCQALRAAESPILAPAAVVAPATAPMQGTPVNTIGD